MVPDARSCGRRLCSVERDPTGGTGGPRPRDLRTGDGEPRCARLHDRAEILAELRQVLGGTSEHPPCPIVIEGLNGTGKTALLNASAMMADDLGLRVGRARCAAAESSAPFGVVRQVFSSLLHQTAICDTAQRDGTDLARRVLRNGPGPTDDPVEVYQSLMMLLATTSDIPVVIGIDDVQWADPMSIGWLQFLVRRLTASSVHLVMTADVRRAGVMNPADALVLDPATRRFSTHPLSIEATTAMLREHLGNDVADSIVATAHRLTGGKPLLIARLLNSLDDLGIPPARLTERQVAELSSPVVSHAVMSVTSPVGSGAYGLLEATAVLGAADLSIVAAVAELDTADAGRLADALADVGVLQWGRPIQFVHPFERNSVYAEIPPARRAGVHAHAARVLAAHEHDVAEIAAHLLRSEPSDDEWAAALLVDAARVEFDAGGYEAAAQILERADREVVGNPLAAYIARLRAVVDSRLGGASAATHLDRAERLGLDPASVAETALDMLDQQQDFSSPVGLLGIARHVRDQLRASHPQMALRVQLAEAVLLPTAARRLDLGYADEPLEPELAASTTGRLIAAVRAVRQATQMQGTHDQLIDTLVPLLTADVLQGSELVMTTTVAAALGALVRIGACEIADPMLGSAIAAATSSGRRLDAVTYAVVLAESLATQGRIAAAEQLLTNLTADDDAVITRCAAMSLRWFAALRERGGHEPVTVPAIPAIPALSAPGLAELGASAAWFAAELAGRIQLLDGDAARALASFDALAAAAQECDVRNPSFAPWRVGRSAALAGLGRLEEGAELAEQNLELTRRFGSPFAIAEGLACVAQFRSPKEQVVLLEEAIASISLTKAELLRCQLLIDLGFARHQSGDEHAARSAFRDGADQAERCGVTRLAGVAGRGLLACGARPRRLQTSGLKSLTPAERRVVDLAASGNTNTTIAQTLFINVKTVESHLTRVYKKLGITDRAELRSALDTDGEAASVA